MLQFQPQEKKPSQDLLNFLFTWKKLTKKCKKQYIYQPKIIIQLFTMLLNDLDLSAFILPLQEILQKLIHTFNNSFSFHQLKIGEIIQTQKENAAIFVLEGNLKYLDKNSHDRFFKKFQLIDTLTFYRQRQFKRSQKNSLKIQSIPSRNSRIVQSQIFLNNNNNKNIKVTEYDTLCLIFDQRQFDYLKHDLIKADRSMKIDFLIKYLFGGYNPIFSHKLVIVQKFKPKTQLCFKIPYQHVSLLYSGLAKLKITDKQQISFQTQLLTGSLLTDPLFQEIQSSKHQMRKQEIICLTECTVLSLDYQQFKKIIKNQIAIKNSIRAKRRQVENNRLRLMYSTKNARDILKDNQQIRPVLNYPIKMNYKKSSKLFRVKANQLVDIESFMTMDFYKKMIQSKQTVVYRKDQCQFKNIIDSQQTKSISSAFLNCLSQKLLDGNDQIGQRDKFEEDVTLKGFFQVGCKRKTQKLSTSIFRKQIPQKRRKPKVYTASNRKNSNNQLIFRSFLPQSAKISHELYKQYSQFQSRVRNSSEQQQQNREVNGMCINSLNFDSQQRFSVKTDLEKQNKPRSFYNISTSNNKRKLKANTVNSSKQTSKTNITSQYKFVKVDTKNIINTIISQESFPKKYSPFIAGKMISPNTTPLKKKNISQINNNMNVNFYPR